ncbi:MAG: hypothetical protein ACLS4Z_09055 [Christensenellaceae bacterium]
MLKGVVRKYFRVQKAKDSNRTAYIVESINGEKVIKSFSRAAYNEGVYHQCRRPAAVNGKRSSWPTS